ncbi:MAG: hypothetical protein ACI4IM_08260 [Acutalibacteraceae bacterium]
MLDIMSVIEDLLAELEAQQNLLRLAEEEAEPVSGGLDYSNNIDRARAFNYADRADIMLTLLYTITDKAIIMTEKAENALKECVNEEAKQRDHRTTQKA